MLFLRAERVVGFGCCQTHGCTAERLRRGGAVGAGRSRRLRRTCVCGAGSTRIHQTGMEKPAIGAAATERWSGRGPGLRHCVGPLTASEFESLIKFRRARRSPANASLQIRTGLELSEPGSDGASDYSSGVFTFRAKAFALDHHRLAVMHQSIDHGGGQSVIDVEDPAPVTEGTIRGDHDRSGLISGRHDLEQQVGTAFVDGQVAQFIKEK